ncbi:MAG: tetratricopeptide repeat protein [Ignavibacteriales bacterium]|nr:tetratricopeptide repeat protein [Ignavibacteriales bacterium]
MRYLFFIFVLFLFIKCSSSEEQVIHSNKYESIKDSTENKKIASDYYISGSLEELEGNYSKAIEYYLKALEIDPQAGIYFSIGKNYFIMNNLPKAVTFTKTAVSLSPQNTEYNYLLADIYASAMQLDSTEKILNRIIELDSNQYQAYFRLGMINEKSKPLKALSIYKHLLNFIGNERSVLIKIAELNERLGNIEETISTAEEILKLDPSNLDLKMILIEAYIKTNKFDKSRELLDETLLSYPNDPDLIELNAIYFLKNQLFNEATNQYLRLLKDDNLALEYKMGLCSSFSVSFPDDSALTDLSITLFESLKNDTTDWRIYVSLAELYNKQKDDSLAIYNLTEAANLATWNGQLWTQLALTLYNHTRYKDIVYELNKVSDNFTEDFVFNLIFGLSHSQLNHHDSALVYLNRAVNLNQNDITAITAYGFTLSQLKRDDEALIYLQKAIKIEPNDAQVLGMLGLIYDNKEMWEECDNSYQKALTIAPDDATLLNNYAYSLAERGLRLDEALKMITKSLEDDPDNTSFLDTKGWVYFQMGEYELAKELLERAMEKDKNDTTLFDHLGDIYFKLNDKEKAIEYWNKALEKDNNNEKIKSKIAKGEL